MLDISDIRTKVIVLVFLFLSEQQQGKSDCTDAQTNNTCCCSHKANIGFLMATTCMCLKRSVGILAGAYTVPYQKYGTVVT